MPETPENIARQRIREAAETGAPILDLSHLGLTALPPEIGRLTNLKVLNLSDNGLTALPPEIGHLTNLWVLYLVNNKLTTLPPEIGRLTNLKNLNLSVNGLTVLPPEIGNLTNLKILDLWNNHLAILSPEIGHLTNLKELNLWRNHLTTLPLEITCLTNLERLDLGGNRLTVLPPEIGHLTNLKELNLEGNNLTALPPEIGHLTNLEVLYLGGNELTTLPPRIGYLTNLKALDLSGNSFTALPPEIGHLINLKEFDLSGNSFTALPSEIGHLTNLKALYLGGNNLTALPPEITRLTNLERLDFWHNHFTALPPEITCLINLTVLDLSGNGLTALPPEIGHLTNLEHLYLRGNPLTLTIPSELVEHGDARAILDFYRAVWEEGRPLNEVRVLVVGQPSVGKTSIVYRLVDGSYDPQRKSTLTIETHALPLGPYTAQVWDFGGQEFMHATHPFFFSARCIYLLVLNVRNTYEQNRVDYWLRTIQAFGGDSPIIVVGNQADAGQHRLDLPYNRLRREYPTIYGFVQTSAAENTGLDDLRHMLEEAIASLPHVRVLFAASHLRVKEALEQEKTQRDVIPRQEYARICAEQGITDPKDQETLLLLLHDLGVVLDFRDEKGEPLTPEGILNPNWVTRAVYRIITDQNLREHTHGRLDREMLRRILPAPQYQPWHRDLIVKLLERFELCYPEGPDVWWLPNAMAQDEPDLGDEWDEALVFEYAYPELPESVITRFIVRAHDWIDGDLVWRWGVVLAKDENRALVRASVPDRRVEIRVIGRENTRRDFLSLIRGHFDAIHRTFQHGEREESTFEIRAVVLPAQYPGLRLDFEELLTLQRDGVRQLPKAWQGRTVRINVTEVLNGYTTPEERREEWSRDRLERERAVRDNIRVEIHHADISGTLAVGKEISTTQTIEHSFNVAASPELQQALHALEQAVGALAETLDADQAEDIEDALESLQEELAKQNPRGKRCRSSLRRIMDTARAAGETGLTVAELASKVLSLLKMLNVL